MFYCEERKMKKDTFYELCKKEEHHLKKLSDTLLLAELLKINYEYSIQISKGITGEDIFKIATRDEQYSNEEKIQIIKNAITVLNIKYNYPIRNDILEQFNKLDFERM